MLYTTVESDDIYTAVESDVMLDTCIVYMFYTLRMLYSAAESDAGLHIQCIYICCIYVLYICMMYMLYSAAESDAGLPAPACLPALSSHLSLASSLSASSASASSASALSSSASSASC